uniref:Uncharacterized protein n=1 Tax=Panagrolaimus sp. JU765 TaxID=591449 RepID=A0AC34RPG1_9BILA
MSNYRSASFFEMAANPLMLGSLAVGLLMLATVKDHENKISDSYAAEIEQVSKQIDFEFETFRNLTKISFETMDDPTVEQIIQQIVNDEQKITDSYAMEIEQVSKQIDFEFETFKNLTKINFETMDDPTVEQIIQQNTFILLFGSFLLVVLSKQ